MRCGYKGTGEAEGVVDLGGGGDGFGEAVEGAVAEAGVLEDAALVVAGAQYVVGCAVPEVVIDGGLDDVEGGGVLAVLVQGHRHQQGIACALT